MRNTIYKLDDINFKLENLDGQKNVKKHELIKKERYAEKINDRIVELNVQIVNLTNQKKLYENKEQILKEKKEDAQASAGIMSMFLTIIPAAAMGITTFDYKAVIISILFSFVTAVPISHLSYFKGYFKLKKEINKIDYKTVIKELKEKEQILSLENQRYDVCEKDILEMNNILDEIELKISGLLEQKSKIQEIISDEINKLTDLKPTTIDKKQTQKKIIFRKSKKDV